MRTIVSSSRPEGAEHAALLRECQQVAAEARRLLYKTRAHVVRALPGVEDVETELTWDPPWTPDKMSDDAKFILGFG